MRIFCLIVFTNEFFLNKKDEKPIALSGEPSVQYNLKYANDTKAERTLIELPFLLCMVVCN